ncbi:hypothetical protein HYQ46_008940 [Verticillium longisporum]|nr:hypothetical protein HYQ46_008940 [Verticillium longisporum]
MARDEGAVGQQVFERENQSASKDCRRKVPAEQADKKKKRSLGLALWSLWGSKHDEMTVEREQKADQRDAVEQTTATQADRGVPMPSNVDGEADDATLAPPTSPGRPRSRSRTVVDEHQTSQQTVKRLPFRLGHDAETASMMTLQSTAPAPDARSVSPIPPTSAADAGTRPEPEVEVAGKRPFVNGLAVPFSLGKEADTASMMTLQSTAPVQDVRSADPMPPAADKGTNSRPVSEYLDAATPMAAGPASAYATPMVELGRPQMEKDMFVTAAEDLPMAASAGR